MRSHRLVALTDVLLRLLDSPSYSILRTREQLGCIVKSAPRSDGVVEGILFLVQSAVYSPYYVYGRIRQFLDGFGAHLRGLGEQDLRTCVDAEIAVREDAPKALQQQGDKLWCEISDREPLFDRDQHETAALRQVTSTPRRRTP